MEDNQLDQQITSRSKRFFASISGEAPSVFNKNFWTGKMLEWCMKNEHFKVQMFRFVDVLPYLNTSRSLTRHLKEYFDAGDQHIPSILKWGAKGAGLGGALTGAILGRTIRANLEKMARAFIIGENTKDALKTLHKIRKDGFAFTVDILGEATVNEQEADHYMKHYLELIEALEQAAPAWSGIDDQGSGKDWGFAPLINVSVKPSALFSQTDPLDFAGSINGIMSRLIPIYRRLVELNGYLCIDMESYQYKNITLELYRRLRCSEEFKEYPGLRLAVQSYLRDTDEDLANLLQWADQQQLPISIRLVKGAYWDYETVVARQNGWQIPVYTSKAETDAAFERHTRMILEHHHICSYACGSHNIRSVAAAMAMAEELGVPEERYEFQVLYGMAEPVRKGLLNVAKRVRLYAPYGDLIPGMAYLVRRLLENTANESFLRQTFVEESDFERLVENPLITIAREKAAVENAPASATPALPPFTNEPFFDFTQQPVRERFGKAIAAVKAKQGRTYPLYIDGRNIHTDDQLDSVNPAAPSERVGSICQAGLAEVDQAIKAATKAAQAWQALSGTERAQYLFKAADLARKRIYELSAWQVIEVGKQWRQAQGDVAEGIDFLEYYAREMIRLERPRRMGRAPGEMNQLSYQPKGVAAVIAPWNFPFAISCGMAAAAMVAGNPVLYKPAGPSSVIGYTLREVIEEAGFPPGVFNYIPGRGSVIGDYLVEHPAISLIAFTGSMEVGHRIIGKAAVVGPEQTQIKKVIAELGGKNAIIIDDDADLDLAVEEVIHSAFAFQGQKCSACSRVIVVKAIYERFVSRLVEAARSIAIGPAENPACFMGPVIDAQAHKKFSEYVERAHQEGTILLSREVPDTGYFVPLTIVEGITPEHRLAQEEIFGPLLAVMKVSDIDQAIDWANQTRFGLTGAIFSRSPAHLEKARQKFNVGNLYLNRGSTGALVERQPFGGFKMSGVGSKAGGPDYLLQFLDPRLVSENTMRRGFAPIVEEDH